MSWTLLLWMLISAVSPVAPEKVLDHKAEFEITAEAVTPVVNPVPAPLAPLGFEALPIPVSSLVEGEPPAFITDSGRLSGLVRFRVTVGGQVHEGTAGELAGLPGLSNQQRRALRDAAQPLALTSLTGQLKNLEPPTTPDGPATFFEKLDLNQFLSESSRLRVLLWRRLP